MQPPLDAPALPADGQSQHGAALAASHEARSVDGDFGAPIIMRLRRNAQALRDAVHLLERLRQPGAPITPAAQWLGDNIALVEEQLVEATEALPARYFRRLPVLTAGASTGSPRVHDIAWAWLPRVHHASTRCCSTPSSTATRTGSSRPGASGGRCLPCCAWC